MKLQITAVGRFLDESDMGKIHLEGVFDSTACGIAYEEFDSKATTKQLTCGICISYLKWAKEVSKLHLPKK